MLSKQWKHHQNHRKLWEFGLEDPLGDLNMEEKQDESRNTITGDTKDTTKTEVLGDDGHQTIAFVRKTPKGWSFWIPNGALK